MAFTTQHSLVKSDQGTVRFDTSLNGNMDIVDPLLSGGVVTVGETMTTRSQPYLVGLKSDGKVYLFDNSDTNYPIGFVDASGGELSADDTVQLQASGRVLGFTGLTIGTPYYANPSSPGNITITKPAATAYPQVIGVAYLATAIEIIKGYREEPTVIHGESNKLIKAGIKSVTGDDTVTTSGFSAINAVLATIDGGSGPYNPTLNEMAVRCYVTGANTFKLYVSKLDGASAGNWVAGTTARNVHWMAMGTPS